MNNLLRKDVNSYTDPGHAAQAATPGQPYRPGYWSTETVTVTEWGAWVWGIDPVTRVWDQLWVPVSAPTPEMFGDAAYSLYMMQINRRTYDKQVSVWHPEQPYIAPAPAVDYAPPSNIDLNRGWTGAARSIGSFSNNGRIEFKVDPGVQGVVVGLNAVNEGAGYVEIDKAWYFSRGAAEIYESGVSQLDGITYVAGDVFSIERVYGNITYKKNGTTVYTSTTQLFGTLFMDTSLFGGGDYVYDPVITTLSTAGALEPLIGSGRDALGGLSGAEISLQPLGSVQIKSINGSLLPLANLYAGQDNLHYGGYGYFGSFYFFEGAAVGTAAPAVSSATSLSPLVGKGSNIKVATASVSLAPLLGFGYQDGFQGGGGGAPGDLDASLLTVVVAQPSITIYQELYVVMNSSMQVTSVFSVSVVKDVAAESSMTISTTADVQALLEANLRTVLLAGFVTPVFDSAGQVWALNTRTGASSTYESYDYNSFGKLGSLYYGCKSDGLYQLDGDSDAGAPIRASVNLGLKDFDSSLLKRITAAYVGVASDGEMVLKVTVGNDSYFYRARSSDPMLKTQRFDLGKGLRANYFELELFNEDGCDFDLSKVEFAAVNLDRRI